MQNESTQSTDAPASLDELMLLFATAIFAKAETLENPALTKHQRSVLRDAIKWDIKKASNLLVPRESRAAAAVAKERGIALTTLSWGHQPKVDPGRKTFILEHYWTVSSLRNRFVGLPRLSVQQIQQVLVEDLMVVWITREENDRLNKLHMANRPNPGEAYRLAGIVIAERH